MSYEAMNHKKQMVLNRGGQDHPSLVVGVAPKSLKVGV